MINLTGLKFTSREVRVDPVYGDRHYLSHGFGKARRYAATCTLLGAAVKNSSIQCLRAACICLRVRLPLREASELVFVLRRFMKSLHSQGQLNYAGMTAQAAPGER